MYRNILTVIDETRSSEMAAHYAMHLADACSAKLFLFYAAPASSSKEMLRRAESHMERVFNDCVERGIKAESLMETGDPLPALKRAVKKEEIDIVFYSLSRAESRSTVIGRNVLKTLPDAIPSSLALVRIVHLSRPHPDRILIPLSENIPAIEEYAAFAAKLSSGFGAGHITLLHFSEPSAGMKKERRDEPLVSDLTAWPEIMEFSEHLKKHHVFASGKLGRQNAGRGITIEAATKRNDLIIMGASRRSLLSSLLRGNPMHEVLRETPCNLIIFRAQRSRR